MGERKGTNKYYPPDYDPNSGGLNKFVGTHALRERARKIHLGIIIIRFEMPYNIWCDGCGNHIGMGVRYNAEKKKVGMYYSTPVYEFRMKCHLCDNHFVIVTDPGNLDYVIKSGARRQENRWDPKENEQVVPEDKTTQKRLFDDAMFKLEHGEEDRSTAKRVNPAMYKLLQRNETAWKDDFAANSALRAHFREKKKELKTKELKNKLLLNKSSLDIELVDEHEEDVNMATLLSLNPSFNAVEKQKKDRHKALLLPIVPVKPLTKQDIGISSSKSKNMFTSNTNSESSVSTSNIITDCTTITNSLKNNCDGESSSENNKSSSKMLLDESNSEEISCKKQKLTLVSTDYNSTSSNED